MNTYKVWKLTDDNKNRLQPDISFDVSTEEINELLISLKEKAARENAKFSVLESLCYLLISKLPLPIHYLTSNDFILRSRKNYDGEIFRKSCEISFNPKKTKISLGRFNKKKEAVFYGAIPGAISENNAVATTICESDKDLFSDSQNTSYHYYTIGKWIVTRKIPVINLLFNENAIKKSSIADRVTHFFNETLIKSCREGEYQKIKLAYAFLSELAGKRFGSTENYKITTAFYYAVQNYYKRELGIIYSSSMTENFGVNIVLPKSFIEKKGLRLDTAVMYKGQRHPGGIKEYNFSPCSNYAKVNENGAFLFNRIW